MSHITIAPTIKHRVFGEKTLQTARARALNREQSIELLNATHDFPCPYMFKVIGLSEDAFVDRVVEAVREALGHSEESPAYTMRRTPDGKHVSVTLEPTLLSAEQVLTVYQSIGTVSGIVITM